MSPFLWVLPPCLPKMGGMIQSIRPVLPNHGSGAGSLSSMAISSIVGG